MTTQLTAPLSDEEMEELDQFLLSEATCRGAATSLHQVPCRMA